MNVSFNDDKILSVSEKVGDPVLKSQWMLESSTKLDTIGTSNILLEKEENYRKLNVEGPSLKVISKKQGSIISNTSNNGLFIANAKQNSTILIKRATDKAKRKLKLPLLERQVEFDLENTRKIFVSDNGENLVLITKDKIFLWDSMDSENLESEGAWSLLYRDFLTQKNSCAPSYDVTFYENQTDGKMCRIVSTFIKKMGVSDKDIRESEDQFDFTSNSTITPTKTIKIVQKLQTKYNHLNEMDKPSFFKTERFETKKERDNEEDDEDDFDENSDFDQTKFCLVIVTIDVKLSFCAVVKPSRLSTEEIQFPFHQEICYTILKTKDDLTETIRLKTDIPATIVKWDHQSNSIGVFFNSFDSIKDSKGIFYIPFQKKLLFVEYGNIFSEKLFHAEEFRDPIKNAVYDASWSCDGIFFFLITTSGLISILSRFGDLIKFNLKTTKVHKEFNTTDMKDKKQIFQIGCHPKIPKLFVCNGYKISFYSFGTIDSVTTILAYTQEKQWQQKEFFIQQGGNMDILIDIWRLSLSNSLLRKNISFKSALDSLVDIIVSKITSNPSIEENIYFIRDLFLSLNWCCCQKNKLIIIPHFINLVERIFEHFIEKKSDSIDIIIQFINKSKDTFDKLLKDSYETTIINKELKTPIIKFKHIWLSIGQKLFEFSSSKFDHFLEINADEIDIDDIDSNFSDDSDNSEFSNDKDVDQNGPIPYKELLESLLYVLTKDDEKTLGSRDYYLSFNLDSKKLLKLKKGNMYFLSGNFLKAASLYERYLKRTFFSRATFLSYVHAGDIDEAFNIFSTFVPSFKLNLVIPNYQFIHSNLVIELAKLLENLYEGKQVYGLSAPACYELSLPLISNEENSLLYLPLDIEKLRSSCYFLIKNHSEISNLLDFIIALWIIAGNPYEAIRICIKFNLWHKSLEVYLKLSEIENSNEVFESNELKKVFFDSIEECNFTQCYRLNRILSFSEVYDETLSIETRSLIMNRYLLNIEKEIIEISSKEKLLDCSLQQQPTKFMPKLMNNLKFLNPNNQPINIEKDLSTLLFNCIRFFSSSSNDFKLMLNEYQNYFQNQIEPKNLNILISFKLLCRYLYFIFLKDSIQCLFFQSKPFKRYYSVDYEEEKKNDHFEIAKKCGYLLSFQEFYSIDYLQGNFLTSLMSLESPELISKFLKKYFKNDESVVDSQRPKLKILTEIIKENEISQEEEIEKNNDELDDSLFWEFEIENDYWEYLSFFFDSIKLYKINHDIESLLTSIKAMREPNDHFIPTISKEEFQQKMIDKKIPYSMIGYPSDFKIPRRKRSEKFTSEEIIQQNELRNKKKRETVNLTKHFFSNLFRGKNAEPSGEPIVPVLDLNNNNDNSEQPKKKTIFDLLSPRKKGNVGKTPRNKTPRSKKSERTMSKRDSKFNKKLEKEKSQKFFNDIQLVESPKSSRKKESFSDEMIVEI